MAVFVTALCMHALRMLGRRLAPPLLLGALVTSCGEFPVPIYALEASVEPLCDDEPHAPRELDENDTCRWLEDGRLFVQTVSNGFGNIEWVTCLWIRFHPPDRPRVEASMWHEERGFWGTRWTEDLTKGRCWVSSDGVGLGASGSPDLTIDIEYHQLDSGALVRRDSRLVLRADALVRRED